jgi:hypothetical protein
MKALDAWTDRVLRVESQHTQQAGRRQLTRRRPLKDQDLDPGPMIHEDRWAVGRLLGGALVGLPRFAGRTLKGTVKTGMCFAGRFGEV